jgi:hypothetical protein
VVLTAAQAHRVARFPTVADFDALWVFARAELLPRYGSVTAGHETRGAYAAAHQELTAFYAQAAEYGEAVVKWLPARGTRPGLWSGVSAGVRRHWYDGAIDAADAVRSTFSAAWTVSLREALCSPPSWTGWSLHASHTPTILPHCGSRQAIGTTARPLLDLPLSA